MLSFVVELPWVAPTCPTTWHELSTASRVVSAFFWARTSHLLLMCWGIKATGWALPLLKKSSTLKLVCSGPKVGVFSLFLKWLQHRLHAILSEFHQVHPATGSLSIVILSYRSAMGCYGYPSNLLGMLSRCKKEKPLYEDALRRKRCLRRRSKNLLRHKVSPSPWILDQATKVPCPLWFLWQRESFEDFGRRDMEPLEISHKSYSGRSAGGPSCRDKKLVNLSYYRLIVSNSDITCHNLQIKVLLGLVKSWILLEMADFRNEWCFSVG